MDFLGYVERNFGCVAEYNRVREEEWAHAQAIVDEEEDYYSKNRKKRDDAIRDGSFVDWAFDCKGCPNYKSIGMCDEEDDVEHGICGDLSVRDCAYRKDATKDSTKLKSVYVTAYPYAVIHGEVKVPADVKDVKDYLRDHWDDIEFDEEPELDYTGTDFDISEDEEVV